MHETKSYRQITGQKTTLFMTNLSSQVSNNSFSLVCGQKSHQNTVIIYMLMRTSECWLSLGGGLLLGPLGKVEG